MRVLLHLHVRARVPECDLVHTPQPVGKLAALPEGFSWQVSYHVVEAACLPSSLGA